MIYTKYEKKAAAAPAPAASQPAAAATTENAKPTSKTPQKQPAKGRNK